MRLVRFSCGCVGFEPGEDKEALIISACDGDCADDAYSFFKRSMADSREVVDGESRPTVGGVKSSVPLGRDEAERTMMEIGSLVADGYNMRAVRRIVSAKRSPA